MYAHSDLGVKADFDGDGAFDAFDGVNATCSIVFTKE